MPGLERMMAHAQIDHQACYQICRNWNGNAQEMFSSEDPRKALPLSRNIPWVLVTLCIQLQSIHTPSLHPDPETVQVTSVAGNLRLPLEITILDH